MGQPPTQGIIQLKQYNADVENPWYRDNTYGEWTLLSNKVGSYKADQTIRADNM